MKNLVGKSFGLLTVNRERVMFALQWLHKNGRDQTP